MKEMFADFLKLLEKDCDDQFAGHLFRFVEQILESTLSLGKDGYTPAFNLTIYARQRDGKTEIVFRPSKSSSVELHKVLRLEILGTKLKTALWEYGRDAWGMTPDSEKIGIAPKFDAVAAWQSVKDIVKNNMNEK